MCKHAHDGLTYWLCYHYNGRITPGTELKSGEDECKACRVKDDLAEKQIDDI